MTDTVVYRREVHIKKEKKEGDYTLYYENGANRHV
jgi:hypothetical protein